ncbi:unnamed protein product [Urochloa humidicola]
MTHNKSAGTVAEQYLSNAPQGSSSHQAAAATSVRPRSRSGHVRDRAAEEALGVRHYPASSFRRGTASQTHPVAGLALASPPVIPPRRTPRLPRSAEAGGRAKPSRQRSVKASYRQNVSHPSIAVSPRRAYPARKGSCRLPRPPARRCAFFPAAVVVVAPTMAFVSVGFARTVRTRASAPLR